MVTGVQIGQQFNYGQYTTPNPIPATPGSADPGAGAAAGSGGPPPPPPIAALGASLKAVLDELTPKGDPSSSDNVSEDQADRLQSLVSSSISGDTSTYLARAMLKFYSEQRHEAVLDRQTLGLAAQGQLMDAAAQLDSEAGKIMTAAIVSLVTTCVASAITIGTAGLSAVLKGISLGKEIKALKGEMNALDELGEAKDSLATIKDLKELKGIDGLSDDLMGAEGAAESRVVQAQKQMKSFEVEFKEAEKLANVAGAIGQIGHAVGQVVGAVGEFNSKATDGQVKSMDANTKRMEAMAENFRTQADAKKAIVDALDEMIHQLLSFVKDMADAKADRMRAIVRA